MVFSRVKNVVRIPKIAVAGTSGSGKTFTSILLMQAIGRYLKQNENDFVFYDTENASAALYSHLGDFYHQSVQEAYRNQTAFKRQLELATTQGVFGVVYDTATHIWDFLLAEHQRQGGTFNTWGKITPMYREFLNLINSYTLPLIVCVRSATEYAQTEGKNGKKEVTKLGVGEQMRNGFEYELDIMFRLDENHNATIVKSRYIAISEFFEEQGGRVKITPAIADKIVKMLYETTFVEATAETQPVVSATIEPNQEN